MSVSGCHVFPYIFDKLYYVAECWLFFTPNILISFKLLSFCHYFASFRVIFAKISIYPNISSIQVCLKALYDNSVYSILHHLSHVANRNQVVKSYSMFEAECFWSAAFKWTIFFTLYAFLMLVPVVYLSYLYIQCWAQETENCTCYHSEMFQINLYKHENRHNRRHWTNGIGGRETGPRSQSQRDSSCQVGKNCCYWRKVFFLFLLLVELNRCCHCSSLLTQNRCKTN